MRKTRMQLLAMGVAAAVTVGGSGIGVNASASKVTTVLPSAGISYALTGDSVSLSNLADDNSTDVAENEIEDSAVTITETTPLASTLQENILNDIQKATGATIPAEEPGTGEEEVTDEAQVELTEEQKEEERFKSLVIANVNDYVNVRDNPSEEDGEIIGKLYDDSVGTFIEETDGWYKIKSGSVEGYVKAEYCVTGEDAVELAKQVGKRIATVTTTTLKVRSGPSTDDEVLGLVPIEDELVVTEELDGWVKVSIEEGEGYVSMDYVTLSTEFVEAESKAEEEARLKKEEEARLAALEQAKKNTKSSSDEGGKSSGGSSKSYNSAASYTTQSSSIGSAVASYAQQFVGNPYVYGGTSLTNGADCSGFVMSVYANFGVSLPHSSGADRSVGAAVDGLANAQPGDIVCYSGHVGIYIGGGQIVHASSAKTGIKISNASYRQVLSVRRIF